MAKRFLAGRFSIARFQTGAPTRPAGPPYTVNGATVHITRDGRYLVAEPPLSEAAEAVWSRLMDNLYYSYADTGRKTDAVQSIKDRLEEEAKQTAVLDIYNRSGRPSSTT